MSGKDWIGNKSTNISTNGFANNSNHEREVNDYYATDPLAAECLLQFGIPLKNIWENAVGGWHLASVFNREELLKKASDIIIRENVDDAVNTEITDFLQYNNPNSWDGDIVT
ncbi:hypothetical protein LNP00_06600, partial [Fructobacillus sp. M158]|nr:hypothetical protein [Fructobacillus parabroussonetiae]